MENKNKYTNIYYKVLIKQNQMDIVCKDASYRTKTLQNAYDLKYILKVLYAPSLQLDDLVIR